MPIYSVSLGDKDKYDLIRFPGGELHIRVHEPVMGEISKSDAVAVTARVSNSDKLIEALLLCDALRQDSNRAIFLILPYLPYGRADRRFSNGDCFGVATFARLINSANIVPITLDAHSAQGLQYFDRIQDLPSNKFIEQAFSDYASFASSKFACGNASTDERRNADPITLLFPDKGARQRYDAVSSHYDHVLHCSKERDLLTGKLKGFKVPEASEFKTKKVLIVDDICDGGGTFSGIADSLKEYDLNLALYVTHGLFSKGLDDLNKRFERIYTTDSFNGSSTLKGGSANFVVYPTEEYFLEHLPALQRT